VTPLTRDDCAARDAANPLAAARARFRLPEGVIYLDGNSLGALPAGVEEAVARAVTKEWGEGLIRSGNAAGWYAAPGRLGRKMAHLLGVAPHQVTVADMIHPR
jgi:kynureninase